MCSPRVTITVRKPHRAFRRPKLAPTKSSIKIRVPRLPITMTHSIWLPSSFLTASNPPAASSSLCTKHTQPKRHNEEQAEDSHSQPCVCEPRNRKQKCFSDKCQICCSKCQSFKPSCSYFDDSCQCRWAQTAFKFALKHFDENVLGNRRNNCAEQSRQ